MFHESAAFCLLLTGRFQPPNLPEATGLQRLEAIFTGKTAYEGIVKDTRSVSSSAEEGFVVFEGHQQRRSILARLDAQRPCSDLTENEKGLRRSPPIGSGDVRFGSLAAAARSKWDVRFTPERCRGCRRPGVSAKGQKEAFP